MIYITQLIYLNEGQERVFDEFEAVAIPAIKKYHGELLFRIRPGEANYIEGTVDQPYEVHLVSFPSQEDFDAFASDEERKKFLHLKEKSIRESILYSGVQI